MHFPQLAQLTPVIAAVACLALLAAWQRSLRVPAEIPVPVPSQELSPKSIAAAEAWEVRLEELGREQCGKIDCKLRLLQALLEESEKSAQELRALVHRAKQEVG